MNNNNKKLLSRALSEAFERKYAHALDESADMGVFAARDYRAEYRRRRKRPFVMAACALLAVAITCSCTWSNRREKIGGYMIEYLSEGIRVFDSYVMDDFPSSRPDYTLGYIPDGYVCTDESEDVYHIARKWENDKGEMIKFRQTASSEVGNYDNKITEKCVFDHNGNEVLYLEVRDEYTVYIYRVDGYNMAISSDGGLSRETVLQMIDSTILKTTLKGDYYEELTY